MSALRSLLAVIVGALSLAGCSVFFDAGDHVGGDGVDGGGGSPDSGFAPSACRSPWETPTSRALATLRPLGADEFVPDSPHWTELDVVLLPTAPVSTFVGGSSRTDADETIATVFQRDASGAFTQVTGAPLRDRSRAFAIRRDEMRGDALFTFVAEPTDLSPTAEPSNVALGRISSAGVVSRETDEVYLSGPGQTGQGGVAVTGGASRAPRHFWRGDFALPARRIGQNQLAADDTAGSIDGFQALEGEYADLSSSSVPLEGSAGLFALVSRFPTGVTIWDGVNSTPASAMLPTLAYAAEIGLAYLGGTVYWGAHVKADGIGFWRCEANMCEVGNEMGLGIGSPPTHIALVGASPTHLVFAWSDASGMISITLASANESAELGPSMTPLSFATGATGADVSDLSLDVLSCGDGSTAYIALGYIANGAAHLRHYLAEP